MLNAMIDWLTVAGVLALVACPILALSAVGAAKGWRASALYGRSLEDTVRSLNRRLADVEAIRARDDEEFDLVGGGKVRRAWITPRDGQDVPSMIREHLGDVAELGKPVCAETEGDCS